MISFATQEQVKELNPIIEELRHKYLNTLDMIGDDLLGDYKAFELPYIVRRIQDKGDNVGAILDFGTGTSCLPAYLMSLGHREVWALDNGSWHPEVNRKNYNEVYGSGVNYVVDDILKNPDCIPDNYFDVIYSVSVMEHIKGYERYIEILNKKLKKGGLNIHVIDCTIPEDLYQPEIGMGRIILTND
jgi:2-polyprenyl-3-methyl-5-hydroxy-6-metoxy-1,4-benzoquinol methylase